jgi:molybdate transport system substrate-binding protein
MAASSLTELAHELERRHEAAHPDLDVIVVTGGSQLLALQASQGAPADLLLLADARPLDALGVEGRPFARGELVVAVAGDEPLSLEALADAQRVVLGLPESPIGAYTDTALAAATAELGPGWRSRLQGAVVSREPNVRLVRAKVLAGVADAAVIYASDGVPGLSLAPLPDRWQPDVRFVVAGLSPEGQELVDVLLSPDGAALVRASGLDPL